MLKRFKEAQAYQAPNHFNMRGLRLQGFEEGVPEKFWMGCSHFLYGGGAGMDASPLDDVAMQFADLFNIPFQFISSCDGCYAGRGTGQNDIAG